MKKYIYVVIYLFTLVSACIAADFTDNGDGTISDSDTGLMWMKYSADINGNEIYEASDLMSWKDALLYCEDLDYAGYTDWRLPNINELRTLVDFYDSLPAINQDFFPNTMDRYWSSTTAKGSPNNAWTLFFKYHGVWDYVHKSVGLSVRAVR